MQDIIITKSEAETKSIGERLAKEAKAGGIYALIGDLGCGKTVFTKGFAKGLGVEDYVDSPTFTIVKEYDEGRLRKRGRESLAVGGRTHLGYHNLLHFSPHGASAQEASRRSLRHAPRRFLVLEISVIHVV